MGLLALSSSAACASAASTVDWLASLLTLVTASITVSAPLIWSSTRSCRALHGLLHRQGGAGGQPGRQAGASAQAAGDGVKAKASSARPG